MIKKSFIIDFDNTIGFFDQIIFLINIIESTYNYSLNEIQIGQLIDYYPNIFRPKLYDIIKLILYFQNKETVRFFILYTCNKKQLFVEAIIKYIEKQIHYTPLFNYILYEKTKYKNLDTILYNIQEENINTHILCFIDNRFFHYKNNTYDYKYIKCENYIYHYETDEILNLFPYHLFERINKNLITSYFKKRKIKRKKYTLPISLYEMNSSFILQSIRNFVS